MENKREEMLAWVKSLKPGDKVVCEVGYVGEATILEVERVTPAGWVKTTNGQMYAQTKWSDELWGRGRTRGKIRPATEKYLREVQQKDAERAEGERRNKIIREAGSLLYKESRNSHMLTCERAEKIVAFFKQLDAEEKED